MRVEEVRGDLLAKDVDSDEVPPAPPTLTDSEHDGQDNGEDGDRPGPDEIFAEQCVHVLPQRLDLIHGPNRFRDRAVRNVRPLAEHRQRRPPPATDRRRLGDRPAVPGLVRRSAAPSINASSTATTPALEETLAWMSHDGMAAYRESREQFTVGDTIDLEALRSERETKDASLLAPGSTSTHKPSSR